MSGIRIHSSRRFSRPSRSTTAAQRSAFCDVLEPRIALSASVTPDGTLVITGTPVRDAVVIQSAGQGQIRLIGVPAVPDGTIFTGVIRINVDLKSGNDIFTAHGSHIGATGLQIPLTILGGNGGDFFNTGIHGRLIANGGAGNDNIYGGDAGDNLKGGKGVDFIDGGIGDDRIEGLNGADTLCGGQGDDTIIGGNGADILYGNQDNDTLRGGDAADLLVGGHGIDIVTGNAGADRFYAALAESTDFASTDRGFVPFANPNIPTLALFGPTTWNHLADAERPAVRMLDQPMLDATNALSEAFVRSASRRTFFISEADDRPATIPELKIALAGASMLHAAEFSSNPQGVTSQDIDELLDDMRAALLSVPDASLYQSAYSLYLVDFRDELLAGGFLDAIHDIPANTAITHSFFSAFASSINVVDDF